MTALADVVSVVVSSPVPNRLPRRRVDGRRTRAPRVEARRAAPALAVATALRLAAGDARRLRFCEDGSVIVANTPRARA